MKSIDKILRVNFVTDVNSQLLARQEVNDPRVGFTYSQAPVNDALNVIYGTHNIFYGGPTQRCSFFVMTEPPEVYRWRLRELAQYRLVLAPNFDYLRRLDNFVPAYGLLPWRIGVAHEFGRDIPNLSKADIAKVEFPTHNLLTTVMSSKWRTRLQRKRIALTNYLEKRLDNFVVFGREINPIEDKVEALTMARYHLAVENSIHPGYFTEKLTDPLLVGNTVFYGGHQESLRGFSQRNIVLIDPEKPRQVLEQIERKLDEPETQEVMNARSGNREAVLETLNLHRQVVIAAEREGLIPSL
jgi:hypothetical protein